LDRYKLLEHNAPPVVPRSRVTPQSARSADALEADHEYLLRGDVHPHIIEEWISFKARTRSGRSSLRPHPYEFHLYYDI